MTKPDDRHAHVLVVDDDPDVLASLSEALADEGYGVSAARDGIEALDAIGRRRPDVVITDLMMPSMNGWELIGALHSDPDLATIPMLVISAARDPQIDRVVPVLPKPLNLTQLLRAIASFLQAGAKPN